MESLEIDDSCKRSEACSSDMSMFNGDISSQLSLLKVKKKKLKIPDFINIISIITFLIFISILIMYLINISRYKTTYKIEEDAYLKPKYSSHNYTTITFENGLKLVLIKVDPDDQAGGVISFDTGYQDTRFEPGFLRLAFISLISKDTSNSEILSKYMGNFNYIVEEFYSSFYFNILGEGFLDYLKDFSKLTYLDNDDERFNDIDKINGKDLNMNSYADTRKNHLLEYLIYGYKNETDGKEIMPYGSDIVKKNLNGNYTIIKEIMRILLSNPSKIKIILYSHYKASKMKKAFLNHFNKIINLKPDTNNKVLKEDIMPSYNLAEFAKKKIIFYQLYNSELNFLEIIYFIDNDNISYNELYKHSQYFLYISYLLNETNYGSLYYQLTHNEKNININSLSSNVEVILKNKIKFSINILLNHFSYNNIPEIMRIVYEYMYKIKLFINSKNDLNINDIRAKELFRINEQNFIYTEDSHEDNFYKNKAKDLFYKDEKEFFLKEMWFDEDFCSDINIIKKYFDQLIPNNSVVLLGIRYNTTLLYNLKKSNIAYLYKNTNRTKYLNIYYSIHDLDTSFEKEFDRDISILSNPKPNDYISDFNSTSHLDYDKSDYNNYYTTTHEEVSNSSDSFTKVFFKKDTSFHLPKVYINIYFFHPFLRPNFSDSGKNDSKNNKLFFTYMLFFAYVKREIQEQLADAFRCGNYFKIEHNENVVYLDLLIFSDKVKKILTTIKEIINNNDDFINKLSEKFELYRDSAIEDFLELGSFSTNFRLKLSFFENITKHQKNDLPHIYNYCNFPTYEYINITYENIKGDLSCNFNSIKYIYIFGYYKKEEAKEIYKIFKSESTFKSALDSANYDTSYIDESAYVKWSLEKGKIDETLENVCPDYISKNYNHTYRFMIFSEYNLKTLCIINMLIKIISSDLFKTKSVSLSTISQNDIYLRYTFENQDNSINNMHFIDYLIDSLENNIDMTKDVDVIGDRFYYLLRNYKKDSTIKHDTLRQSAISSSYANLYKTSSDNSILGFNMDNYKKFVDYVRTIMKSDAPYIEFSCYNH